MKTLNANKPQGYPDKSNNHIENVYVPFCVISHYRNEVRFIPSYLFPHVQKRYICIPVKYKKVLFSRSSQVTFLNHIFTRGNRENKETTVFPIKLSKIAL